MRKNRFSPSTRFASCPSQVRSKYPRSATYKLQAGNGVSLKGLRTSGTRASVRAGPLSSPLRTSQRTCIFTADLLAFQATRRRGFAQSRLHSGSAPASQNRFLVLYAWHLSLTLDRGLLGSVVY